MASLHKNRRTTLERIEKFISRLYFTDVNLYGRLYPFKESVDIHHWALPANQNWKNVKFVDVVAQNFAPASVGQSFAPTWSTHWFKVTFKVPDLWEGKEVHLRWNSNSEALLYDSSGHPLQGFTGCPDHQKREEYIISKCWSAGAQETLIFYVEMACNDMFGAGQGGMIAPPDPSRSYTVSLAEIAVFDRSMYKLFIDLELLYEMAKELTEEQGKGDSRGYNALYTGNEMINNIQAGDVKKAQELADVFFSTRNGERAHTIDAMGHCHIDTAWLWPFDETIRKCARSWSSVVTLMKEYQSHTFVCSQAQQYSWIKEYYPSLFNEIRRYVQEGRFIPVGATWIEMDGNIPSGESFIRQFLYGQRFFMKEFGVRCQEFWLPDTFGYSAQTPQIMKHMGISRFLTQKLSWSLVNKFPHHNFWWEGLDGSTVLVHFPPGDSYEANCKVSEALKTERNLLDKGRVKRSMMLYGFGDGGGGPHRPMLDRLERLKDVDGIPKMTNSTPKSFFDHLETEGSNLCRWVGELYLELHNGTYTSQADMKKYNRRCEMKLRDAELLMSVALTLGLIPAASLDDIKTQIAEAWRLLMVCQFHDVLPGSSIELVHTEAKLFFRQSEQAADQVINQCLTHLGARSGTLNGFFNSLPWPRDLLLYDGSTPVEAVHVPAMSWNILPFDNVKQVSLDQTGGTFTVSNQFFTVTIDQCGRITSLMHVLTGNEAIVPHKGTFGNQLVLFDDIPLYWDAWDCMDYHLETRAPINVSADKALEPVHVELAHPLKVTLKWSHSIGQNSHISQRIHISAVDPFVEFESTVQWAENRKFLKVEFPVNVHSHQATFDAQFGYVTRNTHKNTSWDSAKFEVCGHKWADLSEPNWGVAVLNDSKYGWNVQGKTISLSLLRSPKAPDKNCDMHEHQFRYAFMPHRGLQSRHDVIQSAYNFNCQPLPAVKGITVPHTPFFHVDSPSVVLETVKPHENLLDGTQLNSKEIVIRLYESCGDRVTAEIQTRLPFKTIQECNGLEEPFGNVQNLSISCDGQRSIKHVFTPFQIRSFLLTY